MLALLFVVAVVCYLWGHRGEGKVSAMPQRDAVDSVELLNDCLLAHRCRLSAVMVGAWPRMLVCGKAKCWRLVKGALPLDGVESYTLADGVVVIQVRDQHLQRWRCELTLGFLGGECHVVAGH